MTTTPQTRRKILIVDDESALRSLFKIALSDRYEVETAKDGCDGLQKLENGHYDLVVLDFNMPRMTGIEVIEELRRRGNDTRIILCSAYMSSEVIVRALKGGVASFVDKPISLATFRDVVENTLAGHYGKGVVDEALQRVEARQFKHAAKILRSSESSQRESLQVFADFIDQLADPISEALERYQPESFRQHIVQNY